jgi:3-hydroxyacyl-[acyl-carrier-protein] dehydratase
MSSERKIWGPFEALQVRNYLPHRYPFLFVDRIFEVSVPVDKGELSIVGTRVRGMKNATINEHYFVGHFPQLPITPGVVIIETIAQVSSFAVLPWVKTSPEMKVLSHFDLRLAGVDSTRFRRPFLPGDRMEITVEVIKQRGPIWGFTCKGEIDGHLAVEAEILASVSLEEKP